MHSIAQHTTCTTNARACLSLTLLLTVSVLLRVSLRGSVAEQTNSRMYRISLVRGMLTVCTVLHYYNYCTPYNVEDIHIHREDALRTAHHYATL